MTNPIENFGDYNIVRDDLYAAGGSVDTLYKNVGDTAVYKAAPELILIGGVSVVVLAIGYKKICKVICFMKDRKQKIENEPCLKKEFVETIEAEASKSDNDEFKDCDEINGKE